MNFAEKFKNELAAALGEPVEITAFKNGEAAPYIVILDNTRPIADDNGKVYAVGHSVDIEHYTETSSEENELTEYLLGRNIPFECSQTYLDEERLFITVYSLENEFIEK